MSVLFWFGPETIGTIAWLAHNESLIPTLRGGIFMEMTGNQDNIMPLMATVFLDKFVEVVLLRSHIGSFRTQSWVTGYIFILLSSLQWFFAPWLFIQSRDRMSNATEHL